ncbi:MAG TPA: polysaccharide biosynthesis/export family protein [Chitinophagaceae bacterium]|nr:polysaccharide biosynthesis/export family protein [Chitinophagaceae bacterium]
MKQTYLLILLGIAPFLFSCVNAKKAAYFNNLNESVIQGTANDLEPVVQKNDLLSITVTSLNPEASQMFNTPNTTGLANSEASGYLVNTEGYIQFPMLGNIKAAGLTKKQLKDNITKGLVDGKLLVDPIVNVRYLNFKVTVLGEVNHPSVLNIPNEKVNLLEALGLAGDLTIYGRRDNVLVIRDENGAKTFKRINLNTDELFRSDYYYLKSNDIVYVEPNKQKVSSVSNSSRWIPVMLSAISAAIVVIDRLVK